VAPEICAQRVLIAGCNGMAAPASARETHPEFVQLGRASAAIYKSNSGSAPHIGILITYRTGNTLNNIACREMAKRGFMGVGSIRASSTTKRWSSPRISLSTSKLPSTTRAALL
jgi:hypothetical protein